jgi:hypothetical protein
MCLMMIMTITFLVFAGRRAGTSGTRNQHTDSGPRIVPCRQHQAVRGRLPGNHQVRGSNPAPFGILWVKKRKRCYKALRLKDCSLLYIYTVYALHGSTRDCLCV